MKRWIVTVVDHNEMCDGKAHVLEVCKTKEEAQAFVHTDIERWRDERVDAGIVVDFDKMSAHYDYNPNDDRVWNIEEVEVGE